MTVTIIELATSSERRHRFYTRLFQHACERMDSSLTVESTIAKAKRIWQRDTSRADANLVIAAERLKNADPLSCLNLLLDHASDSNGDSLWNQLAGSASFELSDYDKAAGYCLAALHLKPQLMDCWLTLGEIHEHRGQHLRAIAYYRRGLLFEDSEHACSLKLTQLLLRRKNIHAAIQVLHSSLQRDRRSSVLNQKLATILQRQANRLRRRKQFHAVNQVLAGAAECYRIAAASQAVPEPYLALGAIEQKLGRFTASIAAYRRVLELDPSNALALMHVANHDLDHGNIDEAVLGYEKVLSIDPKQAEAHFRYSRSRKFKPDEKADEYANQILQLIETTPRRFDRMHLHFAAAKVLDDSGNYDLAWKHYDLANRQKLSHSKSLAQRKPKQRKSPKKPDVDDQIRFFSREYFSQTHHGSKSALPIFIVGMPRSGTTLVEQILSSHSEIAGAGELKDIERLRRRMMRSSDANHARSRLAYPELLAGISIDALNEISNEYLGELAKHQGKAIRVTDKMPTNFLHLGFIATLFPNAKIVHCRRNPMDIFVSSYCQNLNAPFCDLDALVEYYNDYKRLMQHWNSVFPIPIYTVDYENLVADPDTETRKLVASTGLAWDDQCLNFNQNERAVRTPSKWQVRQPMYSSSVDRWRRFENHLQDIVSRVSTD